MGGQRTVTTNDQLIRHMLCCRLQDIITNIVSKRYILGYVECDQWIGMYHNGMLKAQVRCSSTGSQRRMMNDHYFHFLNR